MSRVYARSQGTVDIVARSRTDVIMCFEIRSSQRRATQPLPCQRSDSFYNNNPRQIPTAVRRFHDGNLSNHSAVFLSISPVEHDTHPRDTIMIGRSAAAGWNATPVTASLFSCTLPRAPATVQICGIPSVQGLDQSRLSLRGYFMST